MSDLPVAPEELVALARRAGEVILDVYHRGDESPAGPGWVEVHRKEDATPVTEADLRADRLIVQGLRDLAPGIPVISEEGSGPAPGPAIGADAFWLVDPLDGTREFLSRTGEFTVNIGLVRGGRPVAGVVHLPAEDRSWLGAPEGAWALTGDERRRIASRRADPETLTVAASRKHRGPRLESLVGSLPPERVLTAGSSVKLCLLAEGRADLYLRDTPTTEWDTAAADAVLRAAGGAVCTLEGQVLAYGKPDLENPAFVAVGDPSLDWWSVLGPHL